ALEARDPERVLTLGQEAKDRPVAFMFPGGGAQYVDMARDLYRTEPVFRERVDACAEILARRHGLDLLDCLYPAEGRRQAAGEAMQRTASGLPALFVVEYALATLWMSWGIRPQAMIGHSLGEYVAACLAGVFSPETALALVVLRGRLFEELPEGGMLSVLLPEREVRSLIGPELSLAAINGPEQCVVSGAKRAIEGLAALLTARETEFRPIKIDVAAHSQAVDRITGRFRELVATIELAPPAIPYVSNVTGTWMSAEDAVDPGYWARQLRETVRFGDGVDELLREPRRILLEVGPGQGLSTLVRAQPGYSARSSVFSSVRHPHDRQADDVHLLTTLGRLWLAGAAVDWSGFYAAERRRRIPLPSYPFERQRYWVEPPAAGSGNAVRSTLEKRPEVDDWFYLPSWRRTLPPGPVPAPASSGEPGCWLVLRDEGALGRRLVERSRSGSRQVVEVLAGERFHEVAEGVYTVAPGSRGDCQRLLAALRGRSLAPGVIVHLWSLTADRDRPAGYRGFEEAQARGFYSLLALGQALGEDEAAEPVELWVVTDRLHEVESADLACPEKATMLGACKVLPQEYPRIVCRSVDLTVTRLGGPDVDRLAGQLLAEIAGKPSDRAIAYRGAERWVQSFEPVRLRAEREPIRELRHRGVYLITGGLGGVGMSIAGFLGRTVAARLVLAGRSRFPEREAWDELVAAHDESHPTVRRIARLRALESAGAEVLIERADVADEDQMRALVARIDERFGALDGVIHAAGLAGEKALKFMPDTDRAECERHFAAKAKGLYVLDQVLRDREVDFCLLCSSNASILGGLGSAAYAAANSFMDAYALARRADGGTAWISANWDGWLGEEAERLSAAFATSIDRYAMVPEESAEAFSLVVTRFPAGQVVVSTGDLGRRLELWIRGEGLSWTEGSAAADPSALQPRRAVETPYVAPSNELERTIARVWQEALGVEQL
ncbi:MAG TPA: SDR family NAD(P)-dependent oxidoreductase, partial [Thermoanaerobaculia bacterium]|nr:SDR family NAD(P)-dependent oxidoreductase [Thermoanaerobaculia bacterium]